MSSFRLDQSVIPTRYVIKFVPDIPKKTFEATMSVSFKENKPAKEFQFHADDSLKIHSIKQGGKALEYVHKENRLNVKGTNFASAPVDFEFTGSLDQNTMGWYYVNDDLCSSQFEATHARKAFPCFDEPSVKSVFDITIVAPKHLIALSNMPVDTIVPEENGNAYHFQPTPAMCSYLLAIVVGKFITITGHTKRGLPVDVIAVEGKRDYMDFPLEEGIAAIEWFEDFIKVPFPLPRLQLLGVPNFQFGAMENYGLLIFRETALLAKPGVTSISGARRASLVIAHELAHQWAGDSTSPRWWDALWLNEGFASLFPYLAFDDIHPEWDYWVDFEYSETESAKNFDASDHTHAIHSAVDSDAAIESVFDDICYSKAACIIRMIYRHIGREKFRDVLRVYFGRFKNGLVDTSDLCDVFTEVLGKDMKPFFDAWTLQSGFPLVIAEEDGTLTQKRFTNQGLVGDRTWPIPLPVAYSVGGKIETLHVELDAEPLKLKLPAGTEWFKVNSESCSFVRVWHKGQALENLKAALPKLHRTDRQTIISDASALAKAGLISYADVLDILKLYVTETDLLVSRCAILAFNAIQANFPEYKDQLKKLAVTLFKPMLESIGFEPRQGESGGSAQLRMTLLSKLGIFAEDQKSIDYGIELFNRFKQNNCSTEGIDTNLLPYLLRIGSLHVEGGFKFVHNMSQTAVNPEFRSQAVVSQGFVQENRISEALENTKTTLLQDVASMFIGIGFGPYSGRHVWEFVKSNWTDLKRKFGDMAFVLPTIVDAATDNFATDADADELETFFRENPTPVADLPIKQTIENIRLKAKVNKRDTHIVLAKLNE